MIKVIKILIIKKQLKAFIQQSYQFLIISNEKYKNKKIYLKNDDALHYLI